MTTTLFRDDLLLTHTKQQDLKLSEIVSALSYALDITEGQPEGHAIRSCLIGMRLAEEINLSSDDRSALFYALLLKDLGCSSNAAKVCYLFGADEHNVKHDFKFINWQNIFNMLPYIMRNVAPKGTLHERLTRFLAVAVSGRKGAKQLVKIRCERGAAIAQTAEVFATRYGLPAALEIVRDRRGTWFDPQLVDAFRTIARDETFWTNTLSPGHRAYLPHFEPEDRLLHADDAMIDRIAQAFGQVIDAKSPWTACHSQGVSDVAVGIAQTLGLPEHDITRLRRAGLLHDIGKLGVSNAILDKPGKLTDYEFNALKAHPDHTFRILSRSVCFAPIVELAARHHEKLDGSGYHRGLQSHELSQTDCILAVADMYEALAAKRPYRKDLTDGEVFDILNKQIGTKLCPETINALKTFIDQSNFTPYCVAA
ncbi:MAG: HD domain-containing protein [Phycisphaeraceae bacterium]